MNSTKIIVIQLKELIMTVIFSIIGVILLGILLYIFIPKDKAAKESNLYVPGKYISTVTLGNTPVNIQVAVSDKKIESITFEDLSTEQEVFYPLAQPTMDDMAQKIINKQSLDIEISEQSSYTANVFLDAIQQALEEAAIKKND